jgi:competence ComEA-like helix-hairpin-helix protein
MKNLKSHLLFNRQQRVGILFLILLIVGLLGVYFFVPLTKDPLFDISSPELVQLQKQLDSLRKAVLEERKPRRFPFNPNFITDHKAYTLGMSPEEFDRLKAFRDKGQWINSVADFKRVTQISDSLLDEISPLFKLPDWVQKAKPDKKYSKNISSKKTYTQKMDLNTATVSQLQGVSGIGKTLGSRIVAYREKLGGFSSDIQMYEVWGLDPIVVQKALEVFTVKTPKPIQKINISTASASDIATIPGVPFELAKRIWEYSVLHEGITDFSELEKIEGMSAQKLSLIQLYLSIK